MKKILFIILISVLLINLDINVFAESYSNNLQQDLQGIDELTSDGDYLDKIQKSGQIGNIYDIAYEMAKNTEFSSDKQTVDFIKSYLNSKGKCSVSDTDIFNVFNNSSHGQELGYFMYFSSKSNSGEKKDDKKEDQSKKFIDSCKKIFQCLGKELENDNSYTTSNYENCMHTISNLYSMVSPTVKSENELKNHNYGDDMFSNGDPDDSPYDLLTDIENIGTILFRENQSPQPLSFYGENSSNGGGGNSSEKFDLNEGLGGINSIGWNSSGFFNNKFKENYVNKTPYEQLIQNNIDNNIKMTDNNTTKLSGSNNSLLGTSTIVSLGKSIINGSCVNGVNCNNNLTIYYQEQNQSETLTGEKKIKKAYSGHKTYYTPNNYPSYPSYNGWNFGNGNIGNLRNAAFGSNGNGINQKNLNACLSRCDGLSFSDKMICKSRCTCGASSSSDEIFKISICLEPSKKKPVGGGKTVMSIEEINDEIGNTLTNMKESGQLIPHRKNTEMLETALSLVNFAQMFSFTTVIEKKPIFDQEENEEDKKKEQDNEKEINKKYECGIIGFCEQDTQEGKNRYVSSYNRDTDSASAAPGNNNNTVSSQQQLGENYVSQKAPDTSSVASDTAKGLNFNTFKLVSDFLDLNTRFIGEIDSHYSDFNGVSRDMRNKRNF